MLDADVLLKGVGGEVFAVAGIFETTVGHFRDEGDVAVDPHAAGVEFPAGAFAGLVVGAPHGGG